MDNIKIEGISGDNEFIAERMLELHRQDGSTSVVRIEIGRPEKCGDDDEGGEDYRCAYKISGLSEVPKLRWIYGVDSLQALTLCMKMVAVELEEAQRKHKLTWPGTLHDDLLFP
jgi:hypothetical protein